MLTLFRKISNVWQTPKAPTESFRIRTIEEELTATGGSSIKFYFLLLSSSYIYFQFHFHILITLHVFSFLFFQLDLFQPILPFQYNFQVYRLSICFITEFFFYFSSFLCVCVVFCVWNYHRC